MPPEVIRLREKYRCAKTVGRYKGGEHPDRRGKQKRHKNAKHDMSRQRQMILVIGPTGKRHWREI